MRYKDTSDLIDAIERLSNDLARAAQAVYDDWDQVDGYSDAYGTGGICDDVALEMADVISRKLRVHAYSQYNEHDTHTSVMVVVDDMVNDFDEVGVLINVDIHPSNYEEGYGYTWRKIDNVRFNGRMVNVEDMSGLYEEYA